jgi:hypothetical protein
VVNRCAAPDRARRIRGRHRPRRADSIGGTNGTNSLATVAAFTTDKCYPIEQKIAVVENNLSIAVNSLGDLPPQARAGAEKELAALRSQLASLEGQLKTCRGQ